MAPGGGGNIKVVVRVRPFNSRGEFVSLEQFTLLGGLGGLD